MALIVDEIEEDPGRSKPGPLNTLCVDLDMITSELGLNQFDCAQTPADYQTLAGRRYTDDDC